MAKRSRKKTPETANLPFGFILAGILLATAAVYAPVTGFDFVNYDDDVYVVDNPHLRDGLSATTVRWAFTQLHASNWHPLTWLSHALDVQLFGMRPGAHHTVSLLLHLANAALLALLLLRMTGRRGCALAVCALFALHPLRVESVAWIAERKDVLSTFFGLFAMLAYCQALRSSQRWRWLTASVACFACSLLAKPMFVTLPCLLLVLDIWPFQRKTPWSTLLVEKIPYFLLALGSCIATVIAQRSEAIVSLAHVAPAMRLQTTLVAYARYLGASIWPGPQAALYPYPDHWPLLILLAASAAVAGITAAAWRFRQAHPHALTGWLWYLGTLVPVIGLVQVGEQAYANRYSYLPCIGLAIGIVWTLAALLPRRQALILAVVAAVLCGVRTAQELPHWRNSEALFRRALAVTKINSIASNNLAHELNQRGDYAEAATLLAEALQHKPHHAPLLNNYGLSLKGLGKPVEALQAFQTALTKRPQFGDAANNIGDMLSRADRHEEALRFFRDAEAWSPHDASPPYNRANTLRKLKRFDEAIVAYRIALTRNPQYTKAWNNLAIVLAQSGDQSAAAEAFEHVLHLTPDDSSVRHNYSLLLGQMNRYDDAIAQSRQALRIWPAYHQAMDQLATLLLRHPDAAKANPAEAEQLANSAIQLHASDWRYHFRLVRAQHAQGKDNSQAVEAALAVAPNPAIRKRILEFRRAAP